MRRLPLRWRLPHCSIVVKNLLLFLLILLVAVVPLAWRYYQDSRAYEIQNLASRLEFFAERGASWLDVPAITTLRRPEDKQTPAYRQLVRTLNRIKQEFGVDNAIVMRRQEDGSYTYVAAGHGGFAIGQPVHIHAWFPATYKATNDTWERGEMMHSQLFGGRVGEYVFDQFLQINAPLKHEGKVVAILMLNKFANPVAAAVRAKTLKVVGLTAAIVAVGLALFGLLSARLLRPLRALTAAAGAVARGDLHVPLPAVRRRDEVGRLAAAFATMLEGLRQRDFIRDTFGRYLSQEVAEALLSSPEALKLGGELREVTFLVADLRGFTALAAALPPQEVIALLNRYLERMVDTLAHYRGTVDEFQGDGILAFFGAPLAATDDPERAVACAVAMQQALQALNAEHRRLGLPELAMGIGINTGEVVVGNIGSEKRAKYGAVGSAINVAYRIESYTVDGQILISPSTYERVRHLVQVRGTLQVQFKGLEAPLTLYDVAGIGGAYAGEVPEAAAAPLVAVDPPLPVTCFPVEDKAVAATGVAGRLLRLGATAAEVALEGTLPVPSTVLLRFTAAEAGELEVYARAVAPVEQGGVRLRFTAVPAQAKAVLARLRRAA
ncbi:MAG: hypothetical protein KatS3mg131_2019 [Candidatus Tectimicrobiota bacterium]|nr:MAG: hypothetical protein KatS3mg131_2019 [Candidatus Tectomicrobia bacterium]